MSRVPADAERCASVSDRAFQRAVLRPDAYRGRWVRDALVDSVAGDAPCSLPPALPDIEVFRLGTERLDEPPWPPRELILDRLRGQRELPMSCPSPASKRR